ncbi:hypothetical protein F5876DRAFT_53692, partial [Lentinula aff. lateritia]
VIIQYAVKIAELGFPLSPRRLREHVNWILKHCLGSLTPENGLNPDWCQVHASGPHSAARYSEDLPFIVISSLLFFLATHTLSF